MQLESSLTYRFILTTIAAVFGVVIIGIKTSASDVVLTKDTGTSTNKTAPSTNKTAASTKTPTALIKTEAALKKSNSAPTKNNSAGVKNKAPVKSKRDASERKHVLADDGIKDPSFSLMRSQLLTAIQNHDKSFVEDILSDNIAASLGTGPGKKSFEALWQDLAPTSPFWERLERVLLHGAQFDAESDEFHAPGLAFDDSHSSLPQAVVWSKSGGLRKSADDSPPSHLLCGQQISITDPSERAPIEKAWVKIKTNDGRSGYIKSEDIYSAYDEFAVFRKENGKWLLTWFGFAEL